MKLPVERTFKVLEERKNFLIKEAKKSDSGSGYRWLEIGALDRILNFTKMVFDHFPRETIAKMITEYDLNNKPNDEEPEDKREEEVIYTYEREIYKNYKTKISFIKYKDYTYILFQPQRYVTNKYQWEKRGGFKLTETVLEEVLQKIKEFE
jgi:hypothetical protein